MGLAATSSFETLSEIVVSAGLFSVTFFSTTFCIVVSVIGITVVVVFEEVCGVSLPLMGARILKPSTEKRDGLIFFFVP
jgi:hypothetical protein